MSQFVFATPRTRISAATIAVGMLLSGCAGEPEPRFAEPTDSPVPSFSRTTSPDPSTTATEPSGSTPTVPRYPAAAKGKGQDSAVAFMTYYWDLVTYAHEFGDTGPAHAATRETCSACGGALSAIDEVLHAGGEYDGVTFSMTVRGDPTLGQTSRELVASASVTVTSTKGTLTYPDGASKSIRAHRSLVVMRVMRSKDDARWQVASLEAEAA